VYAGSSVTTSVWENRVPETAKRRKETNKIHFFIMNKIVQKNLLRAE
jgi:hypothetical protein